MELKKELELAMKKIIDGDTNEIQYLLQFLNFNDAMIATLLDDMKEGGHLSSEFSSLFSNATRAKAVQEAEGVRLDIYDQTNNRFSLSNRNGSLLIEDFSKTIKDALHGVISYHQTEYAKAGPNGNIRKLNTQFSTQYYPLIRKVENYFKKFKATVSEYTSSGYEMKRIEFENCPAASLSGNNHEQLIALPNGWVDEPRLEKPDQAHCEKLVKKYRTNGIDQVFKDGFEISIPQITTDLEKNDLRISSVLERQGALVSRTRTLLTKQMRHGEDVGTRGLFEYRECDNSSFGALDVHDLKRLYQPIFTFETREGIDGFLKADTTYRPILYSNAMREIKDPRMIERFARDIRIQTQSTSRNSSAAETPNRNVETVDIDDPDVD